jgi:hypothetical protein
MIRIVIGAAGICTLAASPLPAGYACPNLKSGDPVVDATAAASHGDCHLLSLGGYAGVVPGALVWLRTPLMIAGTGDDGAVNAEYRCEVPRATAMNWARRYNQTIVAIAGRPKSKCPPP